MSNSEPITPAAIRPADQLEVQLRLLIKVKMQALFNRITQVLGEAPVKTLLTLACIAVVWAGLYLLFHAIFSYLRQSPLESAVAIPMVFNFFFVAMMIMLAISNAIIAYMSLFAADEAVYLLAAPLSPRAYVALKYLETLFFSSWSLVLMGLPLMIAMADISHAPWLYYPFFLGFFIFFVPIPGALGLLIAWAVARFFTRRVRKRLGALLGLLAAAVIVWSVQSVQVEDEQSTQWLNEFLYRFDFVQHALLPSSWVNHGVYAALHHRISDALWYLAVTLSNAAFLSLLAVMVVARGFPVAFDRALSMRNAEPRTSRSPVGPIAAATFCYLPTRLKLIAAKDLRTFLRDPLQWTQLVILFGLMALYLLNVPRFSGNMPVAGWGMIIPFLNFGAISFILATFTSRFVFPLVSLEGQQVWLIGMLPIRAWDLLLAKFAFAMTVCVGVAFSTTLLAVLMLGLPLDWALLQIGVTLSVCVGLCGLAVGTGARLPMFDQRNAARIANGFGGTVNLVASVALVLSMLSGMVALAVRIRHTGFDGPVDRTSLLIALVVTIWGVLVGVIALWIGARHLRRIEY